MERLLDVKIDRFSYKETVELEDIDFSVNKGEFVVITGKSGCGKTTLLRIINGLIPTFFEGNLLGEARFRGKNVLAYEKGELAKYMGNVFQNPSDQFFSTIADEEVALVGENMGMPRDELKEKVNAAFKSLNIEDLRNKSVFEMSGGQKQKVAIATTLVYDTEIILFDEPSVSLDANATEELKIALKSLKAMGKTVIIAEHRLYYLKELIDRLIVMEDKTIATEYSNEELSDDIRKRHKLRTFEYLKISDDLFNGADTKSFDIDVNNVSAQRGKKIFSRDISFRVKKGECIGIIGENGVGKTTLAKELVGLLPIKTGAVNYGSTKKERLKNAYYLMQDASVQLFASTIENELIPKNCLNNREYLDKVKEYLIKIDLFEKRGRSPHELSVGEKQRLSMIVSFVYDRKCIILDEPTAGLDYERMDMVAGLIAEKKMETPIILITHDIELINKVCDRVLRIEEE